MKALGSVCTCRLWRVSQLLRCEPKDWDEGTLRRYLFPWDVEEILKIGIMVNTRSNWVAW
jgi:hypothetical protein